MTTPRLSRPDQVAAALRPATAPWAVRPAIWALLAALVVGGVGVVTGDLVATGLAYFGVACAAEFVTSGGYRMRAASLLCQAIGAAGGIVLGVCAADSVVAKVAIAAVVALLSGMLGTIGPLTTSAALMAVVGVSFGEFARVRMPGWEQGSWYLVGTLVVAAFALAGWPFHRRLTASGSVPRPVVHPDQLLPTRFRVALRTATRGPALLSGLRVSLCMTIATGVACALHSESHSFWLPLTVAVAVRPEYGSVFDRTVNRAAGTAVGALLAAGAIAVLVSGWPVAIAAAVALAFAVLAGPKLYGLAVVGVTCSTLLGSCIAVADPIAPAVRLLDTLIGCAIAIVFGHLVWGVRRFPVRYLIPVAVRTSIGGYENVRDAAQADVRRNGRDEEPGGDHPLLRTNIRHGLQRRQPGLRRVREQSRRRLRQRYHVLRRVRRSRLGRKPGSGGRAGVDHHQTSR